MVIDKNLKFQKNDIIKDIQNNFNKNKDFKLKDLEKLTKYNKSNKYNLMGNKNMNNKINKNLLNNKLLKYIFETIKKYYRGYLKNIINHFKYIFDRKY